MSDLKRNKFIITGTGRSGTKYCQAIFRICGVNCGHQSVFRHQNVLEEDWNWRDYDGDSSFEAVPLLNVVSDREPHTIIVLVKRNKDAVVESWLKWGLFQNDMEDEYRKFSMILNVGFPTVLGQDTPRLRAEEYWEVWNAYAEDWAHFTFQLEDMDNKELFKSVGWFDKYDEKLVNAVSKKINSNLR